MLPPVSPMSDRRCSGDCRLLAVSGTITLAISKLAGADKHAGGQQVARVDAHDLVTRSARRRPWSRSPGTMMAISSLRVIGLTYGRTTSGASVWPEKDVRGGGQALGAGRAERALHDAAQARARSAA